MPCAKPKFVDKGAKFSPCRQWRYRLWRVWDPDLPPMAAGLLNPSNANEDISDNTVSNQINRAIEMEMGSLIVFNAFAFVTPYPRILKARLAEGFDVVGPDNDAVTRDIMAEVNERHGRITVGWGKDGLIGGRGARIARHATELGIQLESLGTTRCGQPRHPRGVSKDRKFTPWPPLDSRTTRDPHSAGNGERGL